MNTRKPQRKRKQCSGKNYDSSDGGDYEFDDDYEEDDVEINDYYGVKPSGQKFHNVRDKSGKFTKKVW